MTLCLLAGGAIYAGYATLFSTGRAISAYRRLRRWIEGAFAAVFAVAGGWLILGRTP